jgi:hypothetical protein
MRVSEKNDCGKVGSEEVLTKSDCMILEVTQGTSPAYGHRLAIQRRIAFPAK